MPPYKDLVVVACHALFLGGPEASARDLYSPQRWNLQSFQQPQGNKPGEHETFLRHILAGLDALSFGAIADSSLLVFSGGFTASHIELSEARSYFDAAVALSRHAAAGGSCATLLGSRILLEEKATDSYQNLLFSIIEFRKATGRYPETIRVITHAFKTERFLLSHAKAIHWPRDRIRVQGIDPVMSAREYAETVAGEKSRGMQPWEQDFYGTRAPLSLKREQRGWQDPVLSEIGHGLEDEVKGLLEWDGGEDGQTYYKGSLNLPWC